MKLLSVIIFALLFTAKINSQNIQGYGVKVGYVNTKPTYSPVPNGENIKSRDGFSISVYADLFALNDFIFIEPELKYIQKGSIHEYFLNGPDSPNTLLNGVFNIRQNYLSVPISLVYKVYSSTGSTFIKFAPRYDFLLSSNADFSSSSASWNQYKNVFGGTVSIGYAPTIRAAVKPFIEVSYHTDFTDTYSGSLVKIHNSAVEFCFGAGF